MRRKSRRPSFASSFFHCHFLLDIGRALRRFNPAAKSFGFDIDEHTAERAEAGRNRHPRLVPIGKEAADPGRQVLLEDLRSVPAGA